MLELVVVRRDEYFPECYYSSPCCMAVMAATGTKSLMCLHKSAYANPVFVISATPAHFLKRVAFASPLWCLLAVSQVPMSCR